MDEKAAGGKICSSPPSSPSTTTSSSSSPPRISRNNNQLNNYEAHYQRKNSSSSSSSSSDGRNHDIRRLRWRTATDGGAPLAEPPHANANDRVVYFVEDKGSSSSSGGDGDGGDERPSSAVSGSGSAFGLASGWDSFQGGVMGGGGRRVDSRGEDYACG